MAERYRRIVALPAQSFFLLGPRGTGKSTWIRTVLPLAPRIDLLDETRYQTLRDKTFTLFGVEPECREPGFTDYLTGEAFAPVLVAEGTATGPPPQAVTARR